VKQWARLIFQRQPLQPRKDPSPSVCMRGFSCRCLSRPCPLGCTDEEAGSDDISEDVNPFELAEPTTSDEGSGSDDEMPDFSDAGAPGFAFRDHLGVRVQRVPSPCHALAAAGARPCSEASSGMHTAFDAHQATAAAFKRNKRNK